jgi:hypothetical protein
VFAPVAQWIEYRPPKPVAGVRVTPGAHIFVGAWPSGRAPVLGTGGRRFESVRPDQLIVTSFELLFLALSFSAGGES